MMQFFAVLGVIAAWTALGAAVGLGVAWLEQKMKDQDPREPSGEELRWRKKDPVPPAWPPKQADPTMVDHPDDYWFLEN